MKKRDTDSQDRFAFSSREKAGKKNKNTLKQ
jgi:hypothetical protein